jgi:hypothetical protein
MSLAIIDARQWQNRFDLESGQKKEESHPAAAMLSKVLSWNPYPGDVDEKANEWVTRTALDLIDQYEPNLVCLSYVQQFFSHRHFAHSQADWERMCATAMAEADKFIKISGYTPVIVGTGGMIPLKGEIDVSGLDGLAVSSNWSARYCGVHWPSSADMELLSALKAQEKIERIVSKKEWIELFRSQEQEVQIRQDEALMPDFLVVAAEGHSFKTMGTTLRKPVHIPENNFKVPVYTPLGDLDDIRGIKQLVRSNLDHHKIALILVEGVGKAFFPADHSMCENGPGWFCHEPGDAFYLTLSTGKHEPFAYPAGYRSFDLDAEAVKFPFSGYLLSVPENTLALDYPGKSIAVGNRSMFMHMMFGVDISIECFARNLFNQGCLGVIHRMDKYGK